MLIALILTLIIMAGINGLELFLHYKEKRELFNRFMAGDYRLYKYYEEQFPEEVEDMKKRKEKERAKEKTPIEQEIEKQTGKF